MAWTTFGLARRAAMVTRDRQCEVLVVGGGIAGSAVATILARRGVDVFVLERQEVFQDRVRGELLAPWGYAEAKRLGLLEAFLDPSTRANVISRHVTYDETCTPDEAEAGAFDISALVPGVPGNHGLGHPETCEALLKTAAGAGAGVARGVSDVEVTAGSSPTVTYTAGGAGHRVTARLVVGADGRNSLVRRQLGISLQGDEAKTMGAGMLVESIEDWPLDTEALGTSGRVHYMIFPQRDGATRLYLQYPVEEHERFSGPDRTAAFLAAFALDCFPDPERFRTLTALRACASYPWHDTWAEAVLAPGAVLIGDAGGYNDPIIGNGLSLSLRDVTTLSEMLLASSDWSVEALAPYTAERTRLMRRARASALLYSALFCEFGPEAATRRAAALPKAMTDEFLAMPLIAPFVGYDALPDEAFTDQTRERILAA